MIIKNKIICSIVICSTIFLQTALVFAQVMNTDMTPPPMEMAPVEDTTPPVISGVMEVSLGTTDVTIVWSTDESTTSTLRYGFTESYGSNGTVSPSAALMHTSSLTGLTPSTKYFYCIEATDTSGNKSESCGHSFTTADEAPPMDANPPTITAVTVDPITETSATVNWTTNEVADGYVEYGITPDFGSQTPLDSDLSTDHSAVLSGLNEGVQYYYRVVSADEMGNTAKSTTNNFTTNAKPVTEEPTASNPQTKITNIEVKSITKNSVTISWTTDLASDSQMEYGDSELLGTRSTLDTALKNSHTVSLSNLNSNTNYFFKVISKAYQQTNATVSTLHEFTTLSEPIFTSTPANVTSVSASGISTSSATINWSTDIPATSKVEYGLTTEYLQSTIKSDTFTKSHSVVLSNLLAGTLYHYRVKSVNEAGDITYSNDHTFTTIVNSVSQVTSSNNIVSTVPIVIKPIQNQSQNQQTLPSIINMGVNNVKDLKPTHFFPTLVNASPTDSQITLDWNNSNSDFFSHTVIYRNENNFPKYPHDGEKIYEGQSETFTDTNLVNGKKYYYAIFSYNNIGIYSHPIRVALSPKAGVEEIQLNKNPVIVPTLSVFHFVRELKNGDIDIEVEHLQEILSVTDASYPKNMIDGKFGKITKKGLKQFQKIHKLPQTGVTDTATREKLHNVSASSVTLQIPQNLFLFSKTLAFGKNSKNVENLQRFLEKYGSYTGMIDGKFGNETKKAVSIFQKENDIDVDGIVGKQTRHKMRTISGF